MARDGVEPPTPAFSGLRTTDLSPLAFNNLTLQSGPSFVTHSVTKRRCSPKRRSENTKTAIHRTVLTPSPLNLHSWKQPPGWTNVESFLKVCYGSWGQKGCFSVNSMREFADLPPKARQIMVASVMKAHQLLIDNLAAARGSRDDNDSLAGLIVTFFSGICLEQNLGPDRARITKKIDAFMWLIRAI